MALSNPLKVPRTVQVIKTEENEVFAPGDFGRVSEVRLTVEEIEGAKLHGRTGAATPLRSVLLARLVCFHVVRYLNAYTSAR